MKKQIFLCLLTGMLSVSHAQEVTIHHSTVEETSVVESTLVRVEQTTTTAVELVPVSTSGLFAAEAFKQSLDAITIVNPKILIEGEMSHFWTDGVNEEEVANALCNEFVQQPLKPNNHKYFPKNQVFHNNSGAPYDTAKKGLQLMARLDVGFSYVTTGININYSLGQIEKHNDVSWIITAIRCVR